MAQEQVRLMTESCPETMFHLTPKLLAIDAHCLPVEDAKKSLSQMSIEEELTADEEKELAAITANDGPTYGKNETKQAWWNHVLGIDGLRAITEGEDVDDALEPASADPDPAALERDEWYAEHEDELDIE
eukprot:TRINITY_DN10855_c0_g1_i2.p1 TRINITY_DN10855_c0_g1~~TRINITY_DN10855_c0_g1_i2.p1  ORF type:complete len:130 (+),score=39.29 TRINITY_DN10855_c0_g1_i2:100-489(+)